MPYISRHTWARWRKLAGSCGGKFLCVGTGVTKSVPFNQFRFGQVPPTNDAVAVDIEELEVITLCALVDTVWIGISEQGVALGQSV
eukprot:COSAG06_NODE_15337_length_1079_cov_0.865306_1_plen_86_part_00